MLYVQTTQQFVQWCVFTFIFRLPDLNGMHCNFVPSSSSLYFPLLFTLKIYLEVLLWKMPRYGLWRRSTLQNKSLSLMSHQPMQRSGSLWCSVVSVVSMVTMVTWSTKPLKMNLLDWNNWKYFCFCCEVGVRIHPECKLFFIFLFFFSAAVNILLLSLNHISVNEINSLKTEKSKVNQTAHFVAPWFFFFHNILADLSELCRLEDFYFICLYAERQSCLCDWWRTNSCLIFFFIVTVWKPELILVYSFINNIFFSFFLWGFL